MTIYPLCRIERSFDSQIWRELAREDVLATFQELAQLYPYQTQLREMTVALEAGETISLFPDNEKYRFYLRGVPEASARPYTRIATNVGIREVRS